MASDANSSSTERWFDRIAIGQIKFDPGKELGKRLTELHVPERREIGRRALFLSSQYRLVSRRTARGGLEGNDEKKADHLERALRHGKAPYQARLGSYMAVGESELDGHKFVALQFAVHMHPYTVKEIQDDETLLAEAILRERENSIRAIVVYQRDHMLQGRELHLAINKLSEFVTGSLVLPTGGGDPKARSVNPQAYVTNPRFTFIDAPPKKP